VTEVFGLLFATAAVAAIGFQIGLALGRPWGELAMGGRYPGRFTRPMRIAAAVQAAVIAILAVIVVTRAGLIRTPLDAPVLIWGVVAFSGVSLLLNALSRSPGERRLWTPVAAVMLVSSLAVALV
jgi:hypothetical protein